MLIVDDIQNTVCDNDAVGSSKTALNPTGEIHPLLDHNHGVSKGLLCSFKKLGHIGGISGGAIFHFFRLTCRDRLCSRHRISKAVTSDRYIGQSVASFGAFSIYQGKLPCTFLRR